MHISKLKLILSLWEDVRGYVNDKIVLLNLYISSLLYVEKVYHARQYNTGGHNKFQIGVLVARSKCKYNDVS